MWCVTWLTVCLSEWMSLCLGKLLLFQYPVSSVLHGSQGCCAHASSLLQFFCERLRGWCRVPTVVMRSLTYSRRTQVLVGILCSVIRTHLRSVLPWFLFFITRKDLLLGIVYSEISLDSLILARPVQFCFDWYLYLFILLCTRWHIFVLLSGFLLDNVC